MDASTTWTRHPIIYTASSFYLLAALFYILQNNIIQIGGQVAFVKVLWLMTAIFLWFVFPVFIFSSSRLGHKCRAWLRLFWLLMVIRAFVELTMMYITKNWHPYLGIAHDLICAVLLLAALFNAGRTPRFMKLTYVFLCMTLLVEAIFAFYMFTQVKSSDPVYFVPNHSEHHSIFMASWIAVASCILFLVYFTRKWVLFHLRGRLSW